MREALVAAASVVVVLVAVALTAADSVAAALIAVDSAAVALIAAASTAADTVAVGSNVAVTPAEALIGADMLAVAHSQDRIMVVAGSAASPNREKVRVPISINSPDTIRHSFQLREDWAAWPKEATSAEMS